MNKKLFKSTLMVAMIAIAGYGSYKAYEGYARSKSQSMLLAENVEAMTEDIEYENYKFEICWNTDHKDNYAKRLLCGTEEQIFVPNYGKMCLCTTKTGGVSVNPTSSWCYKKK